MSDGPWKSLRMRPHWKRVAKQAENGAFSPEEVSETLEAALLKEAVPLEEVCRAVVPSGQGVLFKPDLDGEFGALWRDHTANVASRPPSACAISGTWPPGSSHRLVPLLRLPVLPIVRGLTTGRCCDPATIRRDAAQNKRRGLRARGLAARWLARV